MEFGSSGPNRNHQAGAHNDAGNSEWAEVLARTVAHLAAQLTVTQIRLRAIASELSDRDVATEAAVQERLRTLAEEETENYLRANLGEALVEIINVDELGQSVKAYLSNGE